MGTKIASREKKGVIFSKEDKALFVKNLRSLEGVLLLVKNSLPL